MTSIQAKVLLCFMGFAVLSIFNINNSFAVGIPLTIHFSSESGHTNHW